MSSSGARIDRDRLALRAGRGQPRSAFARIVRAEDLDLAALASPFRMIHGITMFEAAEAELARAGEVDERVPALGRHRVTAP